MISDYENNKFQIGVHVMMSHFNFSVSIIGTHWKLYDVLWDGQIFHLRKEEFSSRIFKIKSLITSNMYGRITRDRPTPRTNLIHHVRNELRYSCSPRGQNSQHLIDTGSKNLKLRNKV